MTGPRRITLITIQLATLSLLGCGGGVDEGGRCEPCREASAAQRCDEGMQCRSFSRDGRTPPFYSLCARSDTETCKLPF
jgi:hypothetical protein